ncbi:hypothetical protein CB1_000661004 [Camelus ferus]|nr:hypothetical protein CB1_000661004 [Camelus ferus]
MMLRCALSVQDHASKSLDLYVPRTCSASNPIICAETTHPARRTWPRSTRRPLAKEVKSLLANTSHARSFPPLFSPTAKAIDSAPQEMES